jgi:hypothetical protein
MPRPLFPASRHSLALRSSTVCYGVEPGNCAAAVARSGIAANAAPGHGPLEDGAIAYSGKFSGAIGGWAKIGFKTPWAVFRRARGAAVDRGLGLLGENRVHGEGARKIGSLT